MRKTVAMSSKNGMARGYSNTKLWTKTLLRIKQIAALSGESMVATMDRMSTKELGRLQKKNAGVHDK